MKLKTALKIFFFFFLFFFVSFGILYAQLPPEIVDDFDVIVSANINVDIHSQLNLSPSTVEERQPSNVILSMKQPNGLPLVGRTIIIYVEGNATGVSIVQPGPTNAQGQTTGSISSTIAGAYTVCAKDVTEGFEIFIADCKTLYVIPVPPPVMLPEPMYTPGTTNTVMWTTPGSASYQYYVEVSRHQDFRVVSNSSGWVNNQAYEFKNLANGQMYFYRVKARNSFGAESIWSNVVYSVQDATPPTISLIDISDIGENTTIEWERDYTIKIRYRIKDNIGISSRDFWCIGSDGSRYNCEYTSIIDGDFWEITIKLKDLENYNHIYLYNEYRFCVEATDLVNNVARNCDAKLIIPDSAEEPPDEEDPITPRPPVKPPVEKPPPPITSIIRKTIDDFIDTTISKIEPNLVEDLTITTTAANIFVGLSFLLTLGYFPYILLQLFLALMSLFGFRKESNVVGYVYDSTTKEPITQAIVRVFNISHELVWTDVTDSNGYFRGTEIDEGEYYIKVTARKYTFPSKIVFSKKDFPLENVYHGDLFKPEDKNIPNFSIPLDFEDLSGFEKFLAQSKSRGKVFGRVLQILLFFIGLIFSIYALYVTRLWWNYLVIVVYILPLVALLGGKFSKKEKYGIVYDESKQPVKGVVVGLNDQEFGRLVSKRVTNEYGRYRFVVDKGVYELSIMNSDLSPVDPVSLYAIEVEKHGPNILCPDIQVMRVSGTNKEDDILEPLQEL